MGNHTHEDKRFLRILLKILSRLPKRRQYRFWVLLAGMILVACLETIVVGFLAVYASTIANPEIILKSERLSRIQNILHLQSLTSMKGLILFMSIAVTALIGIKNIINGIVTYTTKLYSANISCYIGDQLFSGFLNLPYEWHLSRNSADLIQGVAWRQHFGNLLNASMKTLSDILIVIIMLTTLVIVEPLISVLVILVLGGSALIIFTKIRHLLDITAIKDRHSIWLLNRQVTKAIHGIKDVKVYGREESFTKRFKEIVLRVAKLDSILLVFNQVPGWILETVGVAMLTFSICIMFFVMESSTIKITGTIALLAVTAWRVMPAISRILNGMTQIRRTIPFVHTGFEYLSEIDSGYTIKADTIKPDMKKEPIFTDTVMFNDISFTYQGAHMPALQNIDITIKKGQTLGVIGTSGAGKSTFVDILIGLLSPTAGQILIDGTTLDDSKRRDWLSCIGYVPQTPYIFDGTLAENVAFSIDTTDIDRNRVKVCCEMAAMKDFLTDLPQEIDTPIGERGVRISGGQRQRVAIARALYHEPQLIVFDEATSALDQKNELAVQQTIYSLKQKMTLIIIAHRLTTVENCDVILWLEKGYARMIGNAQTVLDSYRQHHSEDNGNHTSH
ncbi:MAG: ABC transporter ATP-binding protein [Deltaproteobacteria bacterium]|nr:ABC transporter ATP-binding protein [Deltaproteobacteria bacterium]